MTGKDWKPSRPAFAVVFYRKPDGTLAGLVAEIVTLRWGIGDHTDVIPLRRIAMSSSLALLSLLYGACQGGKGVGGPAPDAHGAPPEGDGGAARGVASSEPASPDAGAPPSRDEICARTPAARAAGLDGKKPFTDLDAHCNKGNAFCDVVDKSPDPKATCFVANDNIARAERESLGAKGPPSTSSAWDGKSAPKFLDRIDAHLHLTREEKDALARNRFVVLDRVPYHDYAAAFHDVFQEELPLFVGVDPILYAVFRGTELALERVERTRLVPALASLLKKLRGGLAGSAAAMDADTRNDLDVYLGVAAELASSRARDDSKKTKLSAIRGGDEAAIMGLVQDAENERALKEITLFGRPRMIDFSQLEPRGHYLRSPGESQGLESYFMAVMWLSRTEWNLVSRSSRSSHPGPGPDPRETPREVKDALALAELVDRTGAATELRVFEEVYTSFAGKREDLPPARLSELARAKGIRSTDAEAADKLKAAIGDGFKRTARTHFTVGGAPELPVIMTMLGPRIVADAAPLTRVVHDSVPERKWLGAADAGYALGHDRAQSFIPDFTRTPGLPQAFAGARAEMRSNAAAARDIYGSWLRAVLALGDAPTGVLPSFTKGAAYADHRLNSALVGYGEIRHAFVLLAAQGYDAYGCEIPDAYVEPLPAVFDALLAHVRNMRAVAKGWEGLERVIAALAQIARDETNGKSLTEPQRRWLAMVSEHIANGGYVSTGEPPKWTGWYFDMFEDREHGATKGTSFIADYFTLTNAGEVAYLGGEGPRLGVFIVDTNGEPRAMVGPVAKGFEVHAPIAGRLSDEKVFEPETKKLAAWRASYAVPERPEPPLGLQGEVVQCGDVVDRRREMMGYPVPAAPGASGAAATMKPPAPIEWRVAVRSTRARAGRTSVTLLDHHGDPLTAKLVLEVGTEWQVGVFDLTPELAKAHYGVEALHVRVEDLPGGPFDYVTSPSVFSGKDHNADGKAPERPLGPGSFFIGGK